MCKCNPNNRTPFCGEIGCELPKQQKVADQSEKLYGVLNILRNESEKGLGAISDIFKAQKNRITLLEERNARMKAIIEWYADETIYSSTVNNSIFKWPIMQDRGKKATEALKEVRE